MSRTVLWFFHGIGLELISLTCLYLPGRLYSALIRDNYISSPWRIRPGVLWGDSCPMSHEGWISGPVSSGTLFCHTRNWGQGHIKRECSRGRGVTEERLAGEGGESNPVEKMSGWSQGAGCTWFFVIIYLCLVHHFRHHSRRLLIR